jgi:hypothetical protein
MEAQLISPAGAASLSMTEIRDMPLGMAARCAWGFPIPCVGCELLTNLLTNRFTRVGV